MLRKLVIHQQKNEIGPVSATKYKNQQNVKLLEGNKLIDIGQGNFLDVKEKAKIGLYQSKKPSYIKGNKMKRSLPSGRKYLQSIYLINS